jgi:hypothetical protein
MSDEQQNIAAQELAASVGLIAVITDSNFSVTTNNGVVVKCYRFVITLSASP